MEDCSLPAQVYESMGLVVKHGCLGFFRALRLRIVSRQDELRDQIHGVPERPGIQELTVPKASDAYQMIECLEACEKFVFLGIGALGERIKARLNGDEAAEFGRICHEHLKIGHEKRSQRAQLRMKPWKRYLRGLLRKHPRWTNNAIANRAVLAYDKHEANADPLRPFALEKRGFRSLWNYVEQIRNEPRRDPSR